jgi:two-component system, response regulator RegA
MRETAGLVLVVEDDENLREPLEHLLRQRHFDVVSADTADGALNILGSRRPDAAIVDLQLKQGSGRDVIVRMPSKAPVIIFSGMRALSGELERLRPRTRLVEKPCSLTWLIDTLDEMIARAHGPRPMAQEA